MIPVCLGQIDVVKYVEDLSSVFLAISLIDNQMK